MNHCHSRSAKPLLLGLVTTSLAAMLLSACAISEETDAGVTVTGNTAKIHGTVTIDSAVALRRVALSTSVSQVRVNLMNAKDSLLATKTPSELGEYLFDSLVAGSYRIVAINLLTGRGSDTASVTLAKAETKEQSLTIGGLNLCPTDRPGCLANIASCPTPNYSGLKLVAWDSITTNGAYSGMTSGNYEVFLSGFVDGLSKYAGNLGYLHYPGTGGNVLHADFIVDGMPRLSSCRPNRPRAVAQESVKGGSEIGETS